MWIKLSTVGLACAAIGILVGWLAFNGGNPTLPATHNDEATPPTELGQLPTTLAGTPRSVDPASADVEDFYSTWSDALKDPDLRSAVEDLSEIARAWADVDPAAALSEAADAGDLIGVVVQSAALSTWTEADPSAAVAWLSQQDPSPNLRLQALAVMSGLVSDSVAGAISRLEAMPGGVREHAEQGLAQALLTPTAAFGSADMDLLLDWHSTLEPNDDLTMMLSMALANRHPERTLAWAQTLSGDARQRAIGGAILSMATHDREHAKQLAIGMDGLDRVEAAKTVLHTEVDDDPRTALAWAMSFEAETERKELADSVFSSWCREDPDAAVDELLDLPPGEMRDELAESAAFSVLVERPDLAERLFRVIESHEGRRLVGIMLHERFNRIDPDPEKAALYRKELSKL